MKPGPDVLLVAPTADDDFRALDDAGLSAETVENCLQAILRLERVESPLVVLSSRTLEGKEEAAVRALRATSGHPRVLLTVPPDRTPSASELTAAGINEFLFEPYFPHDLVARAKQIISESRAAPESSAMPVGGVPATWLTDLKELHGSVDDLPRVCENISTLFERQGPAENVSVYLATTPGNPQTLMATSGTGLTAREQLIELRSAPAARALRSGEPAAEDRLLALPLVIGQGTRGLILLTGSRTNLGYSDRDADRLGPLTDQASHAVMTALKIRHLTDLSNIDDLTGLHNARSFRRSLVREFRRARRYERPLSLAIIDLDNFKVYNDKNGHEAGNRCLKRLGELLNSGFRNTDIVCRYGGEEFAIILPEVTRGGPADPTGAWRVIERLRARIEATPFPGEEALPLKSVTISCGIAASPEDAGDPESLVEAADRALYQAKDAGRNRVCVPEEAHGEGGEG